MAVLWKKIWTKAHVKGQTAARTNVAPVPAREPENNGCMKLVAEVKPEVLSHDTKAGELRIWLKKFEAYVLSCLKHASSQNASSAGISQKLDNALALQLNLLVQQTSPVIEGKLQVY